MSNYTDVNGPLSFSPGVCLQPVKNATVTTAAEKCSDRKDDKFAAHKNQTITHTHKKKNSQLERDSVAR